MAIISLISYNNVIEANMIKDLLENEGIMCFLTNENFTTLLPGFTGMWGSGIHVMIHEEDKEKALEIIGRNDVITEIHCPYCTSSNVSLGLGFKKLKKILLIMLSVFSFTPINNINNTYYCKDCRKEFKL